MAAKRKTKIGREHFVLRLKHGWSYDAKNRQFIKSDGTSFSPRESLPKYTRIRFQMPMKKALTKEEIALQSFMQILPPKKASTKNLLGLIEKWPCTKNVWRSPTISAATSGAT